MKSSILITGGAGFIGSHVVRRFVSRYPEKDIINLDKLTYAADLSYLDDLRACPNYTFVQGDIGDADMILDLMETRRVTGIIHLAAESHVDRSILHPDEFARTNVMGTLTLLQTARRMWNNDWQGKLFYYVSTDEVYGSLGTEDSPFTEDSPYAPRSPYSASKAAGDHFVRSYGSTYGMPTLVSHCSNNYGPCQHAEKLIPLTIRRIAFREPIPVFGRGDNVRDWLYVEDHARAIDLIFHRGKPGQTYNIGGSQERRNIDIVRQLIAIADACLGRPAGSDLDLIAHVPDRPGHDLRYAIDYSKLSSELGWKPEQDFDEGLRRTVIWYLKRMGLPLC